MLITIQPLGFENSRLSARWPSDREASERRTVRMYDMYARIMVASPFRGYLLQSGDHWCCLVWSVASRSHGRILCRHSFRVSGHVRLLLARFPASALGRRAISLPVTASTYGCGSEPRPTIIPDGPCSVEDTNLTIVLYDVDAKSVIFRRRMNRNHPFQFPKLDLWLYRVPAAAPPPRSATDK